ncbi:MAG: hypothetical protein R3C52_09875 [Hyphomonadaceae bacterium]
MEHQSGVSLRDIVRNPTRGEELVFNAYMRGQAADLYELKGRDRQVRSFLLNWIVLESTPPRTGLRIFNAVIPHYLDWKFANFPAPLRFQNCTFLRNIDLTEATLGSVVFTKVDVHSIRMWRTKFAGHVSIRETVCGPRPGSPDDEKLYAANAYRLDLRNAQVDGTLDLTKLTVRGAPRPARGWNTRDASYACPALDLSRVEVEGDLLIRGATFAGEVMLRGAQVSDNLTVRGVTFLDAETGAATAAAQQPEEIIEEDDPAQNAAMAASSAAADRVEQDSDEDLADEASASEPAQDETPEETPEETPARLGAVLRNEDGPGVDGEARDGERDDQETAREDKQRADRDHCPLNGDGVRVGADLFLQNLDFTSTREPALALFRWARVGGDVKIETFKLGPASRTCLVNMGRAIIAGEFQVARFKTGPGNQQLSYPGRIIANGLKLDNTEIGGDVRFYDVAIADIGFCGLALTGARIARDLSFVATQCVVHNDPGSGRVAMNAARVQAGGEVSISQRCKFAGQVTFESASFGGGLEIFGGTFTRASARPALVLDKMKAGGAVQFSMEPTSVPAPSYGAIYITGGLSARQLHAPNLVLGRVEFRRDSEKRTIDLSSVRIEDKLDLSGLKIAGVGEPMRLNLKDTSCSLLLLDPKNSPLTRPPSRTTPTPEGFSGIGLNRMRFESLQTKTLDEREPNIVRAVLAFLNQNWSRRFNPQPHRNMAAALRRSGRIAEADSVLRDLEARRRSAGQISFAAVPIHYAYGVFAGYGFSLWRAAVTLVATLLLASGLAHLAWREGAFVPRDPEIVQSDSWRACVAEQPDRATQCWMQADPAVSREYRGYSSIFYALDVVVPVVEFGQEQRWTVAPRERSLGELMRPGAWLRQADDGGLNPPKGVGLLFETLQPLFTIFGWMLTAFLAAGLTRSRGES